MPSHLHEALIELFRHRPSLAAELLTDPLGVPLPPYEQVNLQSGDLTELAPTEYRADAVVTLTDAGGPVLAVVIEVQLRRDAGKRRTWPVYLATLYARLRCPAVLMVICTDPTIASWCAHPIQLGHPGFILMPLVVGPHQVPVVTDPAEAANCPELAVLSAMSHGGRPEQEKVLHALLGALATVEPERINLYTDIVLTALPEAARRQLEALMSIGTYEYQSDFARRYFFHGLADGEAKGEAKALLRVLTARGIEISDEARARINDCTDLDQLEAWISRAATADSIDDFLD